MFPLLSVTVHVTVVDPNEYGSTASLVTPATEQLSAVIGDPRLTPEAVHNPGSEFTDTVAGAVIVGTWLSTTVIV